MTTIEDTIKAYNNTELAFYVKYRYDGLTPKSRLKIDTEITNRGLTLLDLSKLVEIAKKQKNKNTKHFACPRCTSTKYVEVRDMIRNKHQASEAFDGRPPIYEYTRTCSVCNLDLSKNNSWQDHLKTVALYIGVFTAIISLGLLLYWLRALIDKL